MSNTERQSDSLTADELDAVHNAIAGELAHLLAAPLSKRRGLTPASRRERFETLTRAGQKLGMEL